MGRSHKFLCIEWYDCAIALPNQKLADPLKGEISV